MDRGHDTRNPSVKSWEQFVLRHQNLWNVRIHFVSALFFWLSPLLAIFIHPMYLIGFFLSGIIGALGHYITKDGGVNLKETTSEPNVVRYSTKMAFMYLAGTYKDEIEKVNQIWKLKSTQ